MHWSATNILLTIFALCIAWVIFGVYRKEKRFTAYMLLMVFFLWSGAVWHPFDKRQNVVQVTDELPDEFVFMTGVVQEPMTGQEGRIWVGVLTAESQDELTFFQVPYSKGLASDIKELNQAVQLTGKGIPVSTHKNTPKAQVEGFKT